jgi:replication factor C subunit 3/5
MKLCIKKNIELDDNIDEDQIKLQIFQEKTLPFVSKYVPKKIDDIVSQNIVIDNLKKFIIGNALPHLLFYGMSGIGKTSTINCVIDQLYDVDGQQFMVMRLNASSDRGIKVVRNRINKFVSTSNLFNKKSKKKLYKMIILDEMDSMTQSAQDSLRKLIEDFSKTARFCLICNNIQNISEALQSRCVKYRFLPIKKKDLIDKLKYVASQENILYTKKGLDAIAKFSFGDMRKSFNILQSVHMSNNKINEELVENYLGYPNSKKISNLLKCFKKDSLQESYQKVKSLKEKYNWSLNDMITEVHEKLIKRAKKGKDVEIIKFQIYNLMKIEEHLSIRSCNNIQLASFVAIFYHSNKN